MSYFGIHSRRGSAGIPNGTAQPPRAPKCEVLPSVTGVPKIGSLMARVPGRWSGTSAIAVVWQWTLDGADIAGKTGDILQLDDPATMTGKAVSGYEKATNSAGGPITAASSNSKTVVDGVISAPVVLPAVGLGTGVSKAEGDSGSTVFSFPLVRTGDLTGTSTVSWAVTGSGANPANAADFGGAFPSGTATMGPGVSLIGIDVAVSGDTAVEPDETFTVTISSPVGCTLGTVTATGTILNDDVSTDPASINAPTYTRTSAAGAAPLTFDIAVDDTVTASDYLRVQVATDATKNPDGSYVTPTQDILQQMQGAAPDGSGGGAWGAGDLALVGFQTPTANVPYFIHVRVEREDGTVSPWTADATDTIVASVAKLNSTTGTEKSQNATVYNSNLSVYCNNDIVQLCPASADRAATSDKFTLEVTCDAWISSGTSCIGFGFFDGTRNCNSGGQFGGWLARCGTASGGSGITFTMGRGGNSLGWEANNTSGGMALGAVVEAGDIFHLEVDKEAHTVAVSFHDLSAETTAFLGTITLTSLIPPEWWLFAGGFKGNGGTPSNSDACTINFGGSAYAVAPQTGFNHPYA